MKLEEADKLKIVARVFFTDNEDSYEDYREALTEFMGDKKPNDTFINFCTQPYLKPEPGCRILMNSVGHVASVRIIDGYFQPRTAMTQEEGEAMELAFLAAAEANPDVQELDLMEKIGWKTIVKEEEVDARN